MKNEEWRKKNAGSSGESGAELLERIREERKMKLGGLYVKTGYLFGLFRSQRASYVFYPRRNCYKRSQTPDRQYLQNRHNQNGGVSADNKPRVFDSRRTPAEQTGGSAYPGPAVMFDIAEIVCAKDCGDQKSDGQRNP